jgi:hypothetical protein
MKALFARKTRRVHPARDWTGRVARRVRDWLDRYLEAREAAAREASPVTDGGPRAEVRGAEVADRTHPLLMNGGPPAHWLERVKAGAPELLLPPEEGGTPRVAVGQAAMNPLQAGSSATALPQWAESSVPAARRTEGTADSPRRKQRQDQPARDAQDVKPNRKSQTMVSESAVSTKLGAHRNDLERAAMPAVDSRASDSGNKEITNKSVATAPRVGKTQKGNKTSAADAGVEVRHPRTEPSVEKAAPEVPQVPAAADGPMHKLTAKRIGRETNDDGPVLRSPAELWPEIFGEAAQGPVPARFADRTGGDTRTAPFPDVTRRVSLRSYDGEPVRTQSTVEDRFPQVPVPAVRREMPRRSSQGIVAEEHSPEEHSHKDQHDMWPELPHLQDYGAVETERAMRQWERAVRLDREQRGEF